MFLSRSLPTLAFFFCSTFVLAEQTPAPDFAAESRQLVIGSWFADGVAKVTLKDGTELRTDDPRFQSTRGGVGGGLFRFRDTKGVLDLEWEVKPLDGRSATARLTMHNRSGKALRLDSLTVLSGRLTAKHESGKRHVLLNGFVLSPPHDTVRKPGVTSLSSHETAALESPPLAAGWLTGKHNFGRISLKGLDGHPTVTAWADCENVELPAGASRGSDSFFFSAHPSPLAEMERFATLAGEINNAKIWPPRIAWCTWYAGWQRKQMAAYREGMERGIENMIPEINKHFASRGATTMRICDDFIDYGDWPNKTKSIPRGLDRLARLIDDAGLTPGVWWAPYWAEADSKILKKHPEWFARDKKGEIWFETGWQPKGRDAGKFAVFDTSRPEVVRYFEDTARAWKERGFRYASTDFLHWALEPDRFHDPSMTRAEILHAGMSAIRRGLGPDIFYRPINNPLGVAMGIANDTRLSGDSHGDNPTAFYRTAEVWFYNRRLWLNDPSAIVCARYGKMHDINWNRMWMSWMALAGTVLTYGEVIDELPEKYIRMYQRIFPNLPVAGRPLDLWENEPYLLWGMAPGEADGPYELFGVFDLKGEIPGRVELNLDEISSRCHAWDDPPEKAPAAYLVWDFWNEKLLCSQGPKLVIDKPQKDGRIFSLRPDLGRPQLLGTSGHFSCGVVETKDIVWNGKSGVLAGRAKGNGGDETTLFFHLPEGGELKSAKLKRRVVKTSAAAPEVIALPIPAQDDFISWELEFAGTFSTEPSRPFQTGRAATVLK